MRLITVTSSIPTFKKFKFNNDFSLILGDSTQQNNARAHNLGKSTIIRIIEFVLFSGSGGFLSKIKEKYPDAVFSVNYSIGKDKQVFSRDFGRRANGSIKEITTEYDYEYFIRYQNEFDLDNGFRKPEFLGSDLTWKPRLIKLLGFDEELLKTKLELNRKVSQIESLIATIKDSKIDIEKNEEELSLLRSEREELRKSINDLKFVNIDLVQINIVVNDLDGKIYKYKTDIYELEKEVTKIAKSLENVQTYSIDLSDIEETFKSVNLYFGDQVKKSIADLNSFYESVYSNRKDMLSETLRTKENELERLRKEINKLDDERSKKLSEMSNKDSRNKYKEVYERLLYIENRISTLERDIIAENISELEEQRSLNQTKSTAASATFFTHIDTHQTKYKEISRIYSEIMKKVTNIDARIVLEKKTTGNIDILLKSYRNNIETEELKGDTAKRISAAAIDISIRCVQNGDHGFLIHDGVIDGVDKNTAKEFIKVVKQLSKKYDFQYILTALKDKTPSNITKKDIVLELNDYSDNGLLFGFKY